MASASSRPPSGRRGTMEKSVESIGSGVDSSSNHRTVHSGLSLNTFSALNVTCLCPTVCTYTRLGSSGSSPGSGTRRRT
eukprot:2094575-Pyramimonas_sp.AAC.2